MFNMGVDICGVHLKNPVVTASGTFGFGKEYGEYFELSRLGAIAVKGLTLKERQGNKPPRIAETPMGILNSVGLQNPGINSFIKYILPNLLKIDTKIIANFAGNTIDEYCEMARICADTGIHLLELNVSCPNVKEGGVAFGTNPKTLFEITDKVKKASRQPLIVKLSPNVTDIGEMARAAKEGGADALSLINTLVGMRIDINTKRPILSQNIGGLSGPAIKPVAVRMIWQAANAVDLPIIGMGGVSSGDDAVEFMMAGASAVAVGTAIFSNPLAPVDVIDGIEEYMKNNGIGDVKEIIGSVQINK